MAKQTEEEKAEAQARHVAAAVDAQAQKAEAEALKKSKNTEIAAGQMWQEAEHENPFQTIMAALVDEVRLNHKGEKYVRFSWAPKDQEPKKEFEAVIEYQFRERFPLFVK